MSEAREEPDRETNVLWVTENYPPSRGGMAQSCDRIVAGLRRGEVRIDVAHLAHARTHDRLDRGEGGYLLTAALGDDHEHALRTLWNRVEQRHHETPYSHVVAFGGTLPILAAPTFATWLEVPLVTMIRGNDFDTGLFSVRRQPLVLHALASSWSITVVASRQVPRVAAIAPGAAVHHIANGIDAGSWRSLPSERARADTWRAEHVSGGRTTIGLFGQLKRKKGALLLLDALVTAGHEDAVHVILVGDVDDDTDAWLAARPNVETTRLPFLDRFELLAWYPACDLVALPSFYDGLPNVALEAAALGIPLLASDAGGLADIALDGETGFTFAAGDADSCALAVNQAVRASPDARRQLGTNARSLVERSFTARAETDAYRSLFMTRVDR